MTNIYGIETECSDCQKDCYKTDGKTYCYEKQVGGTPASITYDTTNHSFADAGSIFISTGGTEQVYVGAAGNITTLTEYFQLLYPQATVSNDGVVITVSGDLTIDWVNLTTGNSASVDAGDGTSGLPLDLIDDLTSQNNVTNVPPTTGTNEEGRASKYFTCSTDGQPDPTTIEYRDCDTLEVIDETLIVDCVDCEECFKNSGIVKCYGSGTGDSSHTNTDNDTDADFSIGGTGTTQMKWNVQANDNEDADTFTADVVACINSGNTAVMTITDVSNNVYIFPADAIDSAGNADGTGNWLFSGPGAQASGSGKVLSATMTCGGSASGEASLYENCCGDSQWRDIITGDVLTDVQVETLEDCDEDCLVTDLQFVSCAAEAITDSNAGAITVGDQILTIGTKDCNNVVLSAKKYLISNGQEVVDSILTEQCDPAPAVEQVKQCIQDEDGKQWTQIIIADVTDPVNPVVIAEFYYDSDLVIGTPTGDSENFTDCTEYQEFDDVKLCEVDAEFLLLIDSGGKFARYSFYTGEWTNVSTLSVASAGGSADVENYLLYNFVAPDQLTVIDVNTDTQLPNVTIVDGTVINPAVTTNPKTFSAGSFRDADGYLYAQDTAGSDAGLYRVNVTTGEIDFVTTITGVSGSGTSIAINNLTDELIVNGTDLSYKVDWVTGVATVWNNPPIRPNGSTFDPDGNFYVTSSTDTYQLPFGLDGNDPLNWVQLIDDWGPGANSIAYYRTQAKSPSCFFRRYGVKTDGTRELIGDFNVADDTPRTIVGDIDCCGTSSGGGGSDTGDSCANPTFSSVCNAEDIYGPIVTAIEDNATDLTVVEATLSSILTQATAINANTDTVEALLSDVITELGTLDSDDDATALASILTAINNSITELQAIDANTDQLESQLTSVISTITNEGNQTQALLTTISNKLAEPCTGSPINVNVCNQIDISGLQTSLNNILTQVTAIEGNTDQVETLLGTINTTLGTLDGDDDATALALINASILLAITELQSIDANTDTLETLLTTINTTLVTEGDQTQAILTNILAKLNQTCAGSPQVVETCSTIVQREVCLDVGGNVIEAYAVLRVSDVATTPLRFEDAQGNTVTGTPVECTCEALSINP